MPILVKKLKPECELCKEESSVLSSEIVSELIYSLFNPYFKREGKIDIRNYIKRNLEDNDLIDNFDNLNSIFRELFNNFGYIDSSWIDKIDEYREARIKAWEQIKKELKEGKISEEDLSPNELIENFGDEILNDFIKDGYIEDYERERYRKTITFSKKAEKIIGEKVLELSVQNLPKRSSGEEETSQTGTSIFSSHAIIEYDPFIHTFDNIDVHETLLKCALKRDFSIQEEDIVVRAPQHLEKIIYIMLIDVSDSMRGKKFVGAIESAIGLRAAIKKRGSHELHVIAFNHKAREIKRGEILNLVAQGRTDIGLALMRAREILTTKDGTGIIFLITDGEPTSSFNPYLTPPRCAIREAKFLRRVDARLSIIMLGRGNNFRNLCDKLAMACGKSSIIYFSDPLNLKSFFIKNYLRSSR